MKSGITRREREVTDLNEIRGILDRGKIVHVGMIDGDRPYVVPMNYGYVLEDGCLTLYVHGALRGRKLDVISKNPNVFVEIDTDLIPFEGEHPCTYGLSYSSVMGEGTAEIVTNPEEKMQALTILMKTQTGKDFTFTEKLVSVVAVVKITVPELTAKRRPLNS